MASFSGVLEREAIAAAASIGPMSGAATSVYVSAPGVEGPLTLPGLTIETFDSFTQCPAGSTSIATGTALAVGTLSARTLNVACAGAATTSATPMPHTSPTGADYPAADRSVHAWPAGSSSGSPATITLQRPVNYLGVYWFFGNTGDQFVLKSRGQNVISFSTTDLMSLLPVNGSGTVNAIGGGTYERNHYLGGRKGFGYGSNTEPAVYIQFVAPPGVVFDEVAISAGNLEFDNLAIANYSGTFPTTGLVGVPLSDASPAPVLSPSYQEVTFVANDGSGATVTQSAFSGTSGPLDLNTFTRASFTFTGWNTADDGTGTSYADGATFTFTTDTTLYAQWTPVASEVVLPPPPAPAVTTGPSTTAPPDVPVTTVLAPIPDSSGRLPELQPGESMATENGDPVLAEVVFDGANTMVMRGQDFGLNLTGQCDGGCDVNTDGSGRQVLYIRRDGSALVSGFGFSPNTPVHIWMFSEPVYLGALTVAADGTFEGSVYVEGIAPGTHTVQVNGTSYDGNERSANLGVVVGDTVGDAVRLPDILPATGGGGTAPLLLMAAAMMVLSGIVARRGRRNQA